MERRRLTRLRSVVPVTVKLVRGELQAGDLCVGHLAAARIAAVVDLRANAEDDLAGGFADERDKCRERYQRRFTPPGTSPRVMTQDESEGKHRSTDERTLDGRTPDPRTRLRLIAVPIATSGFARGDGVGSGRLRGGHNGGARHTDVGEEQARDKPASAPGRGGVADLRRDCAALVGRIARIGARGTRRRREE